MIWVVVIIVFIIIVALVAKANPPDTDAFLNERHKETQEKTYLFDDQDPENPMYEEMQEEFFDEFER